MRSSRPLSRQVLPFDLAAANIYADVVIGRERIGNPIDGFDAQIAWTTDRGTFRKGLSTSPCFISWSDGSGQPHDQIWTIVIRSSSPARSSALRVYTAAPWACAVAAISRSMTRARG